MPAESINSVHNPTWIQSHDFLLDLRSPELFSARARLTAILDKDRNTTIQELAGTLNSQPLLTTGFVNPRNCRGVSFVGDFPFYHAYSSLNRTCK